MRRAKRRQGKSPRRASWRTRKSLALVFALVFAPFAAQRARAACVEFAEMQLFPLTTGFPFSVELADIDGDGDLDAVSANWTGSTIFWHENDGAGGIASRHTISNLPQQATKVALADIDRDGDPDVLCSSRQDHSVRWFENGADGAWTATLIANQNLASSVAAGDLDGDGDADAAATSLNTGALFWYENDEDGLWTAQTVSVNTSTGSTLSVVAADLDRDGDLDLLATYNGTPPILWYENDGGGAFTTTHTVYSVFDIVQTADVVDVDGDGDLDVASTSNFSLLRLHENLGGDLWATTNFSNSTNVPYVVDDADVDGDGDPDLVSASAFDDKIAWYENDGGGGGWTSHVVSLAADGADDVVAGDFDGDGDPDFVSASLYTDGIAWHRNDRLHGEALFRPTATIAILDAATSIYAADLDGDGDLDPLSTSLNDDAIVWYENGGGFAPHTITSTAAAVFDVVAADLDGDGDLDPLAAVRNANLVAWYENDGDGSFLDGILTVHAVWTEATAVRSVAAADVDGDGDQDPVSAARYADAIAWHENDGTGASFELRSISSVVGQPLTVVTADMNGDGRVDILVASYYPTVFAWYENLGEDPTPTFTLHTISASAGYGFAALVAADIDGDGHVDAVSTSQVDNLIAWHESNGAGTAFTVHTISTVVGAAYDVYAADLDGDGDVDVLSGSNGGTKVAWYENRNGDGTLWTIHPLATSGANSIFATDLDGDGNLDALSASAGDLVAWYENLGTHISDDGFDSDGATTACWSSSVPPVP